MQAYLRNASTSCLPSGPALSSHSFSIVSPTFFNEFTVRVPGDAAALVEKLAAKGILAGVPVSRLEPDRPEANLLLLACTECTTDDDRAAFVTAMQEALP